MAQFDTFDSDAPHYQPPPIPNIGGAPSGTSPYQSPGYQAPSGFAPGEVVVNTPNTPNQTPNQPQQTPSPSGAGQFNPQAIQQYLFSQPASIQSLQSSFPYLMQQGWLPQGSYLENSSTPDEIFVPGTGWIDTLIGADSGTPSGWSWQTGGGMGGYFSDPMMQQYINFAQQAMAQLMGPQQMNPVLQQAIGQLTSLFGASNPGYSQFQDIANTRLGQLQNPLFDMGDGTASPDAMRNSALLRTKLTEPLEGQRAAAQQRALERASSRGIGLGSGVLEQEAQTIDSGFDQMLAQGYRDLMLQEIAAEEARQQEAVGIGQSLASLGGRELPIKLSASGQLAGIGQQLQSQPFQNLMAAMGISQNMAQLPFQALGAAQSAFNTVDNVNVPQQDSMTTLISILSALANQGEGAYQNASNQEGGFWQSLFSQIPGLIAAFNQPESPAEPPGPWG